jgi:DNA polymerase-1
MSKKSAAKTKKLVLLDAHAILHRAYHALPDFVSGRGEPTGGLYGLSTMLLRIIAELKPDQLIACYDLPEVTFRKQLYDGYKSGRKQADDELVSQMIRSRDVFAAFNIPIYEKAGFEADDILGTIVEQMKGEKSWQIIIASGDMDTLQLVDGKRVVVYTLKRGLSETITYDEAAVRARFGFGPELLPDWKGLRGDPSDNIIGITGIGEKTATELITKFGSIEKIYQKLKKNRQAFLDAGIKERIVGLLEAGEEEALFSKTLATIRRDVPIEFAVGERSWREGVDLAVIEKLFAELEFRTLGARARAVLGTTPNPLLNKEGEDTIRQSAESAGGGDPLDEPSKIALWLLDSTLTNPTDSDLQGRTLEELEAEIKKQGLEKVYREIELPLIPLIARAKERGIKVDVEILKQLSTEYHAELEQLERKIHELAGAPFNINSPKQLGEILFDKLQLSLKGLRKTAGGARSTRESELLKLQEAHPIIGEILRYRELAKLVSTYVDAIPALVGADGRLHSQLHQTGAVTGRMSSSDPNLQNIPADEANGDRIRRAFVATAGHAWLALDYSQIEMRVLALLSGDPELSRIFQEGSDVHTAVAARVFRVGEGEVSRDQRRRAKVINFGIIYGMGVSALQRNLNSTRAEAQEFYDGYFTAFPAIHGYFEKVKAEALARGYTETYFGRRRYFPGLKSKLPQIKAMNERMAMNAPLQGTAADIVKLAMINADRRLGEASLLDRAHLLLQVHDELIYEVETEALAEATKLIQTEMENVIPESPIPLRASAKAGPNWAEAK